MMRVWPSLVAYVVAVVCCSWLTAMGKLPGEVLAALMAVAVPPPWQSRGDDR